MSNSAADQPGGLAQGPEEKKGRAGSAAGRSTKFTLLAESTRRVGTAWPATALGHKPQMASGRGVKESRGRHVENCNFRVRFR
jgi:hypothetical protein